MRKKNVAQAGLLYRGKYPQGHVVIGRDNGDRNITE
jgi:hypothetical protein